MRSLPVRIIAIFLTLSGVVLAKEPRLKADHFNLVVHPDAKIVREFDNGWETKMVVEHENQQVRVRWSDREATILFPNSVIRIKGEDTREGLKITTFLNHKKYVVTRGKREVAWKMPGQDVFFRTTGGKITQIVGTQDYLKLRRDTPAGRIILESSVGTTDALLRKGLLETFDGPEFSEHVYMVRGLAFQKGPVTLRVPLPSGPFLNGLPDNRYLLVKENIKPLEQPTAKAPEERRKDPLQAAPRTWSSPELNANGGEAGKDPLSVRKEKRVTYPQDPLKAKTERNSEELLRVKNY